MDFVREILSVTADASGSMDGNALTDERHDLQDVAYHADMLAEAGLVDAKVMREWGGRAVKVTIFRLTWAGNDFLDAVSNDTVWKRTKAKIARLVGTATFEVTKQVAVAELTSMLVQ